MMPTAYIFTIKQCIVVPSLNPASHAPGVLIGHTRWSLDSIDLKLGNPSRTLRPNAYISSMQQCLVVPYVIPANHAPGVEIG